VSERERFSELRRFLNADDAHNGNDEGCKPLGSCVQSSNQEEEEEEKEKKKKEKKRANLANNAEHDPSAARREPSKTVQTQCKSIKFL
jgi:hypothetical protein